MHQISVIIPLYNKEKYIRRAIDSVLAQTYKDFEIIVVDDGSSDEGPVLVQKYEESCIKLIRQQNAGPGAARNRGIAESESPLVAFLDADDEWMPDFLEKCYKALSKNPDCDVAAASYYLGERRKDISTEFRRRGMSDGRWQLESNISDYELKHAIYILHSSATLCKRSVIEKYGGFYAKNHCSLGEDYYLWLQIMFNHKIYRILKPLWWFHHEASELGNNGNNAIHPFFTDLDPIKENCPQYLHDLLEKLLTQFALHYANENVFYGRRNNAEFLINNFPLMKKQKWNYFKLRTKMIFPKLIPIVRNLKHNKINRSLQWQKPV
jgi:glycosyltransferase involved in cell wall biosynthesis